MDISPSIEHAISNYFSQWLGQHPYLAWSIAHPLLTLGLMFITIFALSGLTRAIGRGFEQIWLFLLKTPFKLLQPIFRLIWGSIARIFGHTNSTAMQLTPQLAQSNPSERIEQIVLSLQTLNQEQESLLAELSILMNSSSVQPTTRSISDTKYKNL